jgi:hypothetical protein
MYLSADGLFRCHHDVVVQFEDTVLSSAKVGKTLRLIFKREGVVNDASTTLTTDTQAD